MKKIISGIMIVVWLATLVGGCQSGNQVPNKVAEPQSSAIESGNSKIMVDPSQEKHSILMANLALPAVANFTDTLEAQGYGYRENNSVILIENHYDDEWRDAVQPANTDQSLKRSPNRRIIGADTLVWQVFENAALDSSKHTAIITGYHEGQVKSVFVEANVTVENHSLIRGMVLDGNGSTMDDPLVFGFWTNWGTCVAVATARCLVTCGLSGPLYLHCLAGCEGWAITFCAIGAYLTCLITNR